MALSPVSCAVVPTLQMDKLWSSFSLFDMNEGGFRRASDVFIDELPDHAKKNIVVRTRHNVEVLF